MADTNFNIGLQLTGLGNTVGGLQQTTQAINQVTAAQQRAAQAGQLGSTVAGGILGGLGAPTSVAGVIGSLFTFGRTLVATSGQTKDLSEQLTLATLEFQMLAKAGNDAGVPLTRLIQSFGILDQQRRVAAEGNERLRAAFAAVGISLADLNDDSLRAIDLQRRLAQATLSGGTAQREAARLILGTQGARLLPALQAFAGQDAAAFASDAAIAEVDAYGKAWENLWARVKAGGIEAFATVNQGVQFLFRRLMGDMTDTPEGSRQQREDFEAFVLQARSNAAEFARRAAVARATGDTGEAGRLEALAQRSREEMRMTPEQFRNLRAPDGQPLFEDLAAQRQLAELEKLRADNAEKRRRIEFDSLSTAEKRADLEARIAAAQAEAAGDPDALRAAQAEGRALDLEAKLAGLKEPARAPGALPANAWERMGASFGPGPDRAEEAIAIARDTQRGVERMAASLDSFAALAQLGVPVQLKDQP